MNLKKRNIFGIKELSKEEIYFILEKAAVYKKQMRNGEMKSADLKGKTILNIFFENSTRTRTSFEIAGKRLGADVVNISIAKSSLPFS